MLGHHADEHLERVDNHVKNLGVDPETLTDGQRAALTDLSIRGGNNLVGSKSPRLNKAIIDGGDEAFTRS